ncbi:hypothetical protein [Metabacillus fastidiosus]|uniref:hypothetical protein n=1 Tax=Metabacillus fastidiosus TaxID=1458 RepID=UPI003D2D5A89
MNLTDEQKIGYIIKTLFDSDFLTIQQFLEGVYNVSVIGNSEELDINELLNRVLEDIGLDHYKVLKVKDNLSYSLDNYSIEIAEEFYKKFKAVMDSN